MEENIIEQDYRWKFMSFDFYKEPKNKDDWLECPECGLKPRVWEFNNGRFTHCVCGKDAYNHKNEVKAESIMAYIRRTGGCTGYDSDELRINWNNYISKKYPPPPTKIIYQFK